MSAGTTGGKVTDTGTPGQKPVSMGHRSRAAKSELPTPLTAHHLFGGLRFSFHSGLGSLSFHPILRSSIFDPRSRGSGYVSLGRALGVSRIADRTHNETAT